WPSRDVEATFDPATHQWTVTGAYRVDAPAGLPYVRQVVKGKIVDATKEWDCRERDWKLVLAYNPSARAYEVQKEEHLKEIHLNGYYGLEANDWRPARKDDFARWLQGGYLKPRPGSDPITALRLVVEVPEPTKLGLKPNYAYGKNDLAVEAIPRGV